MSFGKFNGEVVTKWLRHRGDDRNMELKSDFSYTDPDGKRWIAKKGSVINGASIPAALWVTIGPPFVGNYRRDSVIHDVACEERREPHEAVHRMFYHAMRADRVGWVKGPRAPRSRFKPRFSASVPNPHVPARTPRVTVSNSPSRPFGPPTG